MLRDIDLPALRAFLAVATERSFTRGAAQLGLDKSLASRRIRDLERAVGTPLLARTTRSVRPTAEGERLLREVAPAIAQLDAALEAAPRRATVPVGTVAITTTPDLGRSVLAPALVTFRARYPAVRVAVVLSNDVLDLAGGDLDVALRVGKPGGRTVRARRVGTLGAGFYASPAYLERRGTPDRLPDLGRHERLWPATVAGRPRAFGATPPPADVTCADFSLLAELAKLGGGIAVLPTVIGAREVAAGALVRVLPDHTLGGAPLYLVTRPGRPLPARIAVLRDHLLASLPDAA